MLLTVPNSICPKGWRLPTSAEYTALATAYGGNNSTGSTNLRDANGPAFVFAGNYRDGSQNDQGSYGRYWSSTADYSDFAYGLRLDSSSAYSYYYYKYYGYSVRCVAR